MFRDFLNILVVLAVLGYSAPISSVPSDECLDIGARNCSMMYIFAKAALDSHVDFTRICPSLLECTEEQIKCSNLPQTSISEIQSKCSSDSKTSGTTTVPEYSTSTTTPSDESTTIVATRLSWFGKWF